VAADPRLLANRDFVRLWTGGTASLIGSRVTDLALPLAAIVTLRASAFEVGLLNVARYAPFVLSSLLAGVWFDRYRRRPILIAGNLGRAVLVSLVPLASVLHLLSMNLLYAVGFAVGVLTVLFDVNILSYVPGLVERRHLAEANRTIATSYPVAGICGPGLAGLLVGLLAAPVALAVNGLLYLFAAAALTAIGHREPMPPARRRRPPVRRSIAEGLRTVGNDRVLRHLATQSVTLTLFENVVVTVLGVYAVREIGLYPAQLGLVVGAGAVGGLLGAVLADRLRDRLGFGPTLRLATLVACLSPLVLLEPHGSDPASLLVIGGSLAVHGFHLAVFNVNAVTLRRSVTPDQLRGRMEASYRLVQFATIPVGAILGGTAAHLFGLRSALAIGVVGLTSPIVWIAFSPVFRPHAMPDGPVRKTDRAAAPSTISSDP
jgi:MFS family permease